MSVFKKGKMYMGPASSDKNEQFILIKCIDYMTRLLACYPILNQESIHLMNWILGEENLILFEEYLLKSTEETEISRGELPERINHLLERYTESMKTSSACFVRKLLKKRKECIHYRGKSDIEKNVLSLKQMFNLTDQETELIIFLFISNTELSTERFFIGQLDCNRFSGRKYIATALGLSRNQLNSIIEGTISRVKILDEMHQYSLELCPEYIHFILNPSAKNITEKFFKSIPKDVIPLDFHFTSREQTKHIMDILKNKPLSSTHILLYGPPGTGKTSYAYGLAKNLNVPAYEIIRGDDNVTKHRRAAITACLNMTDSRQGSLVIVDEADNLLNTHGSWLMRGETQDKGWFNELLEKPGLRMIWITNTIDNIESSVLRRFSYSLCFKGFSQKQRIILWENILKKNKGKRLLSAKDLSFFSSHYNVSAGAVDIAVKKAVEKGQKSKEKFKKAVTLALDSHMALMNGGKNPINKDSLDRDYSLEGLNIQGDLKDMVNQIERFDEYLRSSMERTSMNMNLLFYGPPGTGKSEMARFIANYLGKEMVCKKASDILDCYVGNTERKISQAFEQAESNEAILIVDEIDTFLFSRNLAQRSWEISFTNEFLTQMERFRGILIGTTNRVTGIDQASVRRFNHKIEFMHLTQEGNLAFYKRLLAPLISFSADEEDLSVLKKFTNLTPGDFKIVRDRFSFYSPEKLSHRALVNALADEARIKNVNAGDKIIGFRT